MKRLVFCFDGTWNRLDATNPTNVVLTAQSVTPVAPGGVVQIIHYDAGVGTTRTDKWTGGLFGGGLLAKVVDAYTFLTFNYEVGDEIYVFGFSRGAFTARSFAGLLRNCGIVRRSQAARISDVVARYEDRPKGEDHDSPELLEFRAEMSPQVCVDEAEDAWRAAKVEGYVPGSSPVLRIRYLGVWDTVGALGVPRDFLLAGTIDAKYQFHDLDLSPMTVAARHAVAIDEQRRSFEPTLWKNVPALNASLGFSASDPRAPYQQKWFPGVHGSVGGGGDVRGLSDAALQWVWDGATSIGLRLDTAADSTVFGLRPDVRASLVNSTAKDDSVLGLMERALPREPRHPGPDALADVSESAARRWREDPANLPEGVPYRPSTLDRVAAELGAAAGAPAREPAVAPTTAPAQAGGHHTVKRGETLRGIALAAYGRADAASDILRGNAGIIDDADRIYVGQVLFMPNAPAEPIGTANAPGAPKV